MFLFFIFLVALVKSVVICQSFYHYIYLVIKRKIDHDSINLKNIYVNLDLIVRPHNHLPFVSKPQEYERRFNDHASCGQRMDKIEGEMKSMHGEL